MAVWSEISLNKIGHAFRIEAEYYHPRYIRAERQLHRAKAASIKQWLDYVTDGTHVTPRYVKVGVPFLSSSDISDLQFPHEYEKFISQEEHEGLWHCQPMAGDVLISKSGRIGTCAVVPKRIKRGDVNIYEGLALLRLKQISPYYVAVFLASRYGQLQIHRELKGVAQPHLHLEDLRRLLVFVPDKKIVSEIETMVIRAARFDDASFNAYKNAVSLLSSSLKLDALHFERPLSYTANFSDVLAQGRADADYFQIPYVQLRERIRESANGYIPLTDLCDFLKPNIDPSKAPKEQFRYVELADINGGLGLVDKCESYCGAALPSRARRQVKSGDVLASAVVGSIDKSAVVGRGQDDFIASTGFFHLRPKPGVPSEFLLMLMRSPVVQMQLKQQATGGILSSVPDSRVKYVLVPRVDAAVQKEVAKLVKAAHKKHGESLALLEEAKARVEQLIEEAAKS